MDFMDIDLVVDVPDTPDRLAAHNSNGNSIRVENNSSMNNHSVSRGYFNERFRNQPREKGKSVTDNGSRRLFIHPENLNNCSVSVSGNPSSFKNSLPNVDRTSKLEKKHYSLNELSEKGKASCSSQSKKERGFVDEQHGRAHVLEKVISTGAPGDSRAQTSRKGLLSANGFPSLHGTADSLKTSDNSHKVNEKVDDTYKNRSSLDCGKLDFAVSSRHKAENTAPAFLQPVTSPKVTGQKRLVRNGCIAPHNIAKAKQLAENQNTEAEAKEGQNDTEIAGSGGAPSMVDIRDLIAETKDSHRFKGKRVLHHAFSSKEPDARNMHFPRRSSTSLRKETDGSSGDPSRCFVGLDGWRTTHDRMRKVDPPLLDEDLHISRVKDDSCFANQQHKSRMVQRDNQTGNSAMNLNDHPENSDPLSSQHVSAPPQTVSSCGHTVNALPKRQRQGRTSRNLGECSTSAFGDSEIVFLSPSAESLNSGSTRNKSLYGVDISNPVIELDELSLEIRNNRSNTGCNSNGDSSVRARQLEADEMLARELQEQLYNEEPAVATGEIDALVALALQQDERPRRAFLPESHHVYNPRGSSVSNLNQRSQSRSSVGPSVRRGIQAQAPSSTRMARLRGRFPGRSRTISSSTRNSLFPPEMDVDMRMHILEAMEAFSDMEVPGGLLNVAREFNENDYEMLLALDENNHQYGGASAAQINGLPQSKVQTDNLEECAVCLETPTIGETIRHLPCLHRFHKDCIDPWLRRKTSCPVCKSSIT